MEEVKRKKFGGRKAGTPNKINGQLKEMILGALDGVGGIEYLQRQAEEKPAAFLQLIGKVLPMQITGEGGGPLKAVTRIEIVALADDESSDKDSA